MERQVRFWSVDDKERLTASSVDEAMEEYLDLQCPDDPVQLEEHLRGLGLVTVTGYAAMELDPPEEIAAQLLDDLFERHSEYTDPDGADEATQAMKDAALELARVFTRDLDVWACESVTKVEVNALDWVKENAPEWLRPADPVSAPPPGGEPKESPCV